jgi:hypothetical protein
LRSLRKAPLAYNKPDTMTRGDRTAISLVIDATPNAEPAQRLVGFEGFVIQNTTKIARHMSAELKGEEFTVEPSEPQRRLVTAASAVEWRWYVTPQEAGKDKLLVLDVYAHLEEDNEISLPIVIRTFRDRIRVEVTTWDRIIDASSAIGAVNAFVAAIVGSGWGLFVWWRKKSWRRESDEAKTEAVEAPKE